MWGMFYRRLNPKAAADAQRPLIVDWRMVILVQIVPNAALSGLSWWISCTNWAMRWFSATRPGFRSTTGNSRTGRYAVHGRLARKSSSSAPQRTASYCCSCGTASAIHFPALALFSQIQFHFQQFILLLQPGVLDPQGLIPARAFGPQGACPSGPPAPPNPALILSPSSAASELLLDMPALLLERPAAFQTASTASNCSSVNWWFS